MIINEMTNATLIRMAGDENEERGVIVFDTAGQGSTFAPLATALSLGKSLEQNFKDFVQMARLGRVCIPNFGFIDDILLNSDSEPGMREAAIRVTRTLNALSLKSNPAKTALMVIGNNEAARRMRKKFTDKPLVVQNHEVKLSQEEPYLGFKISQKGLRDSVDKSLQMRIGKAWARVFEIRHLANNPKMAKIGWLKVCIALISSQVVSALCYGVEAWIFPLVRQTDYMELSYKKIVYKILEIQETSNYSGILFETGLPRISDIVKKLRITYMNDVLWGKVRDDKLREMLHEDHLLFGDKSVKSEISSLCLNFKIPDVTTQARGPKTIKWTIRQAMAIDVWEKVMRSRLLQPSNTLRSSMKWYHDWPRQYARAHLFFKMGTLRFRAAWRGYYEKRGDSVSCPSHLCGIEVDSLEHAKSCRFLETKFDARRMSHPKEFAKYLVKLSHERFKRWRLPLW